ncbi:MAG: hypothetical protein JEZ01_10040 [Labilibaculum sp.]|nr:hypothetical protein [Labilibaculum sp.]MBI9058096.1 hypothetical protein [Labilibaculum sp.]
MNEFNFQKAISKYGILLTISYLFTFVWMYFYARIFTDWMVRENYMDLYDYLGYIPTAVTIIFNCVFAVLVHKDFKRNGIKNTLVVVITLFDGFVGVTLFFIQYIYTLHIQKVKKIS